MVNPDKINFKKLCKESTFILSILGSSGCGKTTLLKHILQQGIGEFTHVFLFQGSAPSEDNIYIDYIWPSNIHYILKYNTYGKYIFLFNDIHFTHCIKTFSDMRNTYKKPVNFKTLLNKQAIIKQAGNGNNKIINDSCFNNVVDNADDVYASLLVSQKPKIGPNIYTSYIDPNLYDMMKEYQNPEYIDKTDKIISFL